MEKYKLDAYKVRYKLKHFPNKINLITELP